MSSVSTSFFRGTGPGRYFAVGVLVCTGVSIAAAIKKINILKSGALSLGGSRHSTRDVTTTVALVDLQCVPLCVFEGGSAVLTH